MAKEKQISFYFFRFGANNKLNTHIKQQIVKEYMRWREAKREKKTEKQERANWIEINSNKSNDIKKICVMGIIVKDRCTFEFLWYQQLWESDYVCEC